MSKKLKQKKKAAIKAAFFFVKGERITMVQDISLDKVIIQGAAREVNGADRQFTNCLQPHRRRGVDN